MKIDRNPFEVPVWYTPDNLADIRRVAEARQEEKEKNKDVVRDKRIIPRDDTKTIEIGLLGEYAFSKLVYLDVDTDIYLKGDAEKDFTLYGVTIEVKTLRGYLTFIKLSDFVADVGVLVIYNPADYSRVWVQGWITKQEFRSKYFEHDFGYGMRPCVQPAELHPISSLKTYCMVTRNMKWLLERTHT